jgi:short-subunit dehydrogenase
MATWKRALVTGASSGIGREIARQLAADGTELVVVARNEARLVELAESVDVNCQVLVADLADPTELSYVEERLRDVSSPIDLLVNNAGFGFTGPIEELDIEREAAVVDVNVVALHRLSLIAARTMVAAGRGGILNVSSIAGFLASPDVATYAATKSFVTTLSESMHTDLKRRGVHVSALCPGFTRTEFQHKASYDTSNLPDMLWQSPEDVAAAGLAGIEKNTAVVIPGVQNKVGAMVFNAMPRRVRRFALDKLPV